MADTHKIKRPEKQYYRNPRYDKNVNSSNVSETSYINSNSISACNQSSGKLSPKRTHKEVEKNNVLHKRELDSNVERIYNDVERGNKFEHVKIYDRTGYRKSSSLNTSKINDPKLKGPKYSKNEYDTNNKLQEKQHTEHTNNSIIEQPKIEQKPTEKHGGLIRLPKNIDIYQSSSTDTKAPYGVNYKQKPVAPRQNYTKTSTFEQHAVSTVSTVPSLSSPLTTSANLPTPWTEVAKIAFHQFMQSTRSQTANNLSEAPNYNLGSAPHTQSVPFKAPNEAIGSLMSKIMQLDSTLSALLVPPGLYVHSISGNQCEFLTNPELLGIQPNQMSQSQRLFVQWWSTIDQVRQHLFQLFAEVILTDLDFCNTAHVEQGMWKSVFYTVLELLRSWIQNPVLTRLISSETAPISSSSPPSSSTSLSNIIQAVCIRQVIDLGTTQLTQLLTQIQQMHRINLDRILLGDSSAGSWFQTKLSPPPETRSRTRRLVYLSSQKLMLFLGDLARYRELLMGSQNFGKARSWYQKAQLLVPKNGRSYNQLAVLAVYTSRHLDAMCYYMRTLAASNPFATASQSLSALFNEIRPRAEALIVQIQKSQQNKLSSSNTHSHSSFHSFNPRFQRVEIWIHPIDGQVTVIQGGRRLLPSRSRKYFEQIMAQRLKVDSEGSGVDGADEADDDDEEEDEEAQAEAEEYANMSLIDLSRQFGLTFIHAHGKLYTKIGMETFPEVASLALQALSGLLAQKPCPLSVERLYQLFVVNMFNVDRAASMTNKNPHAKLPSTSSSVTPTEFIPSSRLAEIETLRSVHHDHSARFALDTFSLVCRRTAHLLHEAISETSASVPLSPDARILLSAVHLWADWMILHPEHWLPPPNHRDPMLRPHLDDWNLVAQLCTQASRWLARKSETRPTYDEIQPTTSLVLRLKDGYLLDQVNPDDADEDLDDEVVVGIKRDEEGGLVYRVTFLNEESFVAGFKPMLDVIPKMYRYTGNWHPDIVSDFIRLDKLVLFGDYLCGIEPPVLNFNVDQGIYESAIKREASERLEDRFKNAVRLDANDESGVEDEKKSDGLSEDLNQSGDQQTIDGKNVFSQVPSDLTTSPEASQDIVALRLKRTYLQLQLAEEARLTQWRRNAIRQAASGAQRALELEVRPIYLLPDTNCYIDWLEGVATLAQLSSNYTVLVPIIVVNELDNLARYGSSSNNSASHNTSHSSFNRSNELLVSLNSSAPPADVVTRAGLIQERAQLAIRYLEQEFAHRNGRLRALTARGSLLDSIAYRNEINGGRSMGDQTNDDVILTCCHHFCKDSVDKVQLRNLDTTGAQPLRLSREVVLLTSDRNLRLKSLNANIPVRPLRIFVQWSRLPLVANISQMIEAKSAQLELGSKSKISQPEGQWKHPLYKHS